MQFHAHSLFGDGPRRPLTIGERALWLARLDAARRARRITPAHELVARALLKRLGPDGRLDPAQDTLAHDTGLSERTVRRAIRALADAGLLTWQRRLVRDGWRCRQTSNAYALVPKGPALPLPPPRIHRQRGSTASLSAGGAARSDVEFREITPVYPARTLAPGHLRPEHLALARAALAAGPPRSSPGILPPRSSRDIPGRP